MDYGDLNYSSELFGASYAPYGPSAPCDAGFLIGPKALYDCEACSAERGACNNRIPCNRCGRWVPCPPCSFPKPPSPRVHPVVCNWIDEKPVMPAMPTLPPVVRLPSEAFYVAIRDALREDLPRCVRNYRRRFSVKNMKLRHLAAEKQRLQLLTQRKQKLSRLLVHGEQRNVAHQVQKHLKWLQAKRRIVSDMKAHLQRRVSYLVERTEILRAHNAIVRSRSELLRYGNYLRRIAESQQEKRKHKGIFW